MYQTKIKITFADLDPAGILFYANIFKHAHSAYEEMIEKALKKTPDVKGVYIHKKSMKKSQVTEYKNWFEAKGIKVFSSKDRQNDFEGGWCKHWIEFEPTLDSGNFLN